MATAKHTPDSAKVSIRLARLQDAPAFARLARQLGYPSSPDQIRKRMTAVRRDHDHLVLAADFGGHVLGWAHAYVRRSIGSDVCVELAGLVVDEAHRGRGVGSLLMDGVEAWAQCKRVGEVCLRSNIIRNRAHKFYEARGYAKVKSQHAFRKTL